YIVVRSTAGHQLLRSEAGQGYTFPLETFEKAILSCLRELDPHEILNGAGGPDEVQVLGGRLADLEAEYAEAKAFMAQRGVSQATGERVADLEALKRALGEELAAARQRAAHPLSETWGEAQALIRALERAMDPQDARLRLRAALRRMVAEIRLLVVPRGQ